MNIVLIFYDYVITFKYEVEHYWQRKITVASVLFLSNRYVPLLLYGVATLTKSLSRNPFSWTRLANVLWVEQPVGVRTM